MKVERFRQRSDKRIEKVNTGGIEKKQVEYENEIASTIMDREIELKVNDNWTKIKDVCWKQMIRYRKRSNQYGTMHWAIP